MRALRAVAGSAVAAEVEAVAGPPLLLPLPEPAAQQTPRPAPGLQQTRRPQPLRAVSEAEAEVEADSEALLADRWSRRASTPSG